MGLRLLRILVGLPSGDKRTAAVPRRAALGAVFATGALRVPLPAAPGSGAVAAAAAVLQLSNCDVRLGWCGAAYPGRLGGRLS